MTDKNKKPFSRNPSEYTRMVEERNEQLKTLEQSRNSTSEYHLDCAKLRAKEARLRDNTMCKRDKEIFLREINALRKKLGFEPYVYNKTKKKVLDKS